MSAALARVGQSGWGRSGWRGGPGWINHYKCNLFVNYATKEARVSPPLVNNRQATAPELGNRGTSITWWHNVTDGSIQDGDIVSTEGHTGIVVHKDGKPHSISSNSIDGHPQEGTIVHNDWGFRLGQTPTIRRCSCSK